MYCIQLATDMPTAQYFPLQTAVIVLAKRKTLSFKIICSTQGGFKNIEVKSLYSCNFLCICVNVL